MTTKQNATIKRATTAAQLKIGTLDEKTTAELIAIYQRAAAELGALIRFHAGGDGNVGLFELRNLLDQVNGQLRALGQVRDGVLTGALTQSAELGVEPMLGAALSSSASMIISNEALQFVRTFIAEDGLQLSDRIWRLDRQTREEITGVIEQAVIQGHGASQTATELLSRGLGVPADVRDKLRAASADTIHKAIDRALAEDGSIMENALKLSRTEINRAHGEAFAAGAAQIDGFGGLRFLLSPAHPKPDICDLLSTQNLYGLGPGVYPSRAKTPWPAHPNTLSFLEIVFADEITAADRAGKQTSLEALQALTPARQIGVLGVNKREALQDGKLTKGMIRAPWSAVSRRIGGRVVVNSPIRKEGAT